MITDMLYEFKVAYLRTPYNNKVRYIQIESERFFRKNKQTSQLLNKFEVENCMLQAYISIIISCQCQC